VEELIV